MLIRRLVLLLSILLLASPVLTLLFHSHVMSNHTARDGAENGMMVQEMTGHRAHGRTFEATFRLGRRNARQHQTGRDGRDREIFHNWNPRAAWKR